MKTLPFFLILTGLTLSPTVAFGDPEADELFRKGYEYYNLKQYGDAVPLLEEAVERLPEEAQYHYILAKNYGRIAEQSSWFKAIGFAKKTLKHLEIARGLDKENIDILTDLATFYRTAPFFLGGSWKKADEIEDLIAQLRYRKRNISKRDKRN